MFFKNEQANIYLQTAKYPLADEKSPEVGIRIRSKNHFIITIVAPKPYSRKDAS